MSLSQGREYLIRGQFGAIAPYLCEHCGPVWDEPEIVCIARETWGRTGGEPAEHDWRCPACGRLDCIDKREGNHPFTLARRYSIQRNPKYRGDA